MVMNITHCFLGYDIGNFASIAVKPVVSTFRVSIVTIGGGGGGVAGYHKTHKTWLTTYHTTYTYPNLTT
jgi:hypothetical protein